MSGGNFCRSRSLVDIRSLRASTDDAAEGGHVVSHSSYSEAEGLELLITGLAGGSLYGQ
jgi:hypothetical protein